MGEAQSVRPCSLRVHRSVHRSSRERHFQVDQVERRIPGAAATRSHSATTALLRRSFPLALMRRQSRPDLDPLDGSKRTKRCVLRRRDAGQPSDI
jgi:hypothetical protein